MSNAILFSDFNRKSLYQMVEDSLFPHESIDTVENEDNQSKSQTLGQPNPADEDIRYKEEKELLAYLLFAPKLEGLRALPPNSKTDYMNGLHLCMVSKHEFHYGMGIFKDSMEAYDRHIKKWGEFLNMVVEDVKNLPEISWDQTLELKFENAFSLLLAKNKILKIDVSIDCIDKAFQGKGKTYSYGVYLPASSAAEEQLLVSGKSDGKGKDGRLCAEFNQLNDLVVSICANRQN